VEELKMTIEEIRPTSYYDLYKIDEKEFEKKFV